ncbi:selenoprotein W-related protein [Halovenus aranensis]|jgi:selenoprotein W-related protein|uniref:Selenoprotein W-related protein n=1 Tax=Halovenus aranensis TaxID=890420 RepID=A0A1G8U763_9EURY|nr:Rdx family protein [Halovenus aranensis]SDJ49563.1 selenoprotein W-related protein [Halovenus aranensis]
MSEVTIEYCVPCGFRDRALDVQEAILNAVEGELEELSLVMGDHGVFTVHVDGETVFDKEDDEFDVDEIARDVRSAV